MAPGEYGSPIQYVENAAAWLVSRSGNRFKSFPYLTTALRDTFAGRALVLDGEIVHLGPDGRPLFYELIRHRGPQHFYAFDALWIDGASGACRCSSGSAACAR
jgi:ATP-dependent DNA ligase